MPCPLDSIAYRTIRAKGPGSQAVTWVGIINSRCVMFIRVSPFFVSSDHRRQPESESLIKNPDFLHGMYRACAPLREGVLTFVLASYSNVPPSSSRVERGMWLEGR